MHLVETGADIKTWLDNEGLTLCEAEKRLGIHRMTLYRWIESGERLSQSTQMVFLAAQAGLWRFLPEQRAPKSRARNKVREIGGVAWLA